MYNQTHCEEARTGSVVKSTTSFPEEKKKITVLKSGPIRCAAVDREFRYLITAGDDKMLKVWNLSVDELQLLSERYVTDLFVLERYRTRIIITENYPKNRLRSRSLQTPRQSSRQTSLGMCSGA